MAVKPKEKKIRHMENGEGSDVSIKLHKTNCDKLYRWSMWRMYLNEELSRVISARSSHMDLSNTVNNVTSPYLRHPDGKKYGRQMKNLFKSNFQMSRSVEILPDNEYLVFGLPRVSVRKQAPGDIARMHESMHELETLQRQRLQEAEETERQITKLFEFATLESTNADRKMSLKQQNISDDKGIDVVTNNMPNNDLNGEENKNSVSVNKAEINLTKSEKNVPLVSKSRLFWETLAGSKDAILELGKERTESNANSHEHTVISEEILQKQQKLLTKTIPKRSSKDLWRTLRERKTEILQMREMMSGNNPPREKKHQSKTSHLWGFIFHKKKELLQMKRGHKVSHEDPKVIHDSKKNKQPAGVNSNEANILPRKFEDSFQKELAEKLRKRMSVLSSPASLE